MLVQAALSAASSLQTSYLMCTLVIEMPLNVPLTTYLQFGASESLGANCAVNGTMTVLLLPRYLPVIHEQGGISIDRQRCEKVVPYSTVCPSL